MTLKTQQHFQLMTSHFQKVQLTHHLNLTPHTSGLFTSTSTKFNRIPFTWQENYFLCVSSPRGSNGHMNETAVTKQAIIGRERYERVRLEGEDVT